MRSDIEEHCPILTKYAAKSRRILELGPCYGDGSTKCLTWGIQQSKAKEEDKLYVSVDIINQMDERNKPTMPYWHFILGDTGKKEIVDKILKQFPRVKFDLIFIDTDHGYDHMKKEMMFFPVLSHENTIWLYHDTYWNGQYNHMTDAIIEFCPKTHQFINITKNSHGLGALYPKNYDKREIAEDLSRYSDNKI